MYGSSARDWLESLCYSFEYTAYPSGIGDAELAALCAQYASARS